MVLQATRVVALACVACVFVAGCGLFGGARAPLAEGPRVERSRAPMSDDELGAFRQDFAGEVVRLYAEASERARGADVSCDDGGDVLARVDALVAIDRKADAAALVDRCIGEGGAGTFDLPVSLLRAAGRVATVERRFGDAVTWLGHAARKAGPSEARAVAIDRANAIWDAYDTPAEAALVEAVSAGFVESEADLVRPVVVTGLSGARMVLDEANERAFLAYVDALDDGDAAARLLFLHTRLAVVSDLRYHDALRAWWPRLARLRSLPPQGLLGLSALVQLALMHHPNTARGLAETRALARQTVPMQRRTAIPFFVGVSPYAYAELREGACRQAFANDPEVARIASAFTEGRLPADAALVRLRSRFPSATGRADIETLRGTLLEIVGREEAALDAYFDARRACPYYGRAVAGTSGVVARLVQAARPDALQPREVHPPPSLARYVTNYAVLSERQRRALAFTLEFWFPYLDQLKGAGRGLYVQPTFQRLSETPAFAPYAKTIASARVPSDGRLLDDLEGFGGASTTVTFAALENYRWGVAVHETAHQFHVLAEPRIRACISGLFAGAKARETFASAYASTNEHEYFAVGVQHYAMPEGYAGVSGVKREWYRAHDPQLFALLGSIAGSAGDMRRIACPR